MEYHNLPFYGPDMPTTQRNAFMGIWVHTKFACRDGSIIRSKIKQTKQGDLK